MTFDFTVSNHLLTLSSQPEFFSGNENYYDCKFNYISDDWNELDKFAVFTYSDNSCSVPVEGDRCLIPSEVLEQEGAFCVGMFGINPNEDDHIRISTNLVYLYVGEGTYKEASAPTPPSPDLWETYYAEIAKAGDFSQRAEEAARLAHISAQNSENSNISATQALSDLLRMIGNDIATLVDGKIPVSQIPSLATTEIYSASNLEEMHNLSAQNGDICIRTDENKSYIFSDGWIFLVSPTDYAARCGYAETAKAAENAATINNHRLIEMTAADFDSAVKDPDTYYLVY